MPSPETFLEQCVQSQVFPGAVLGVVSKNGAQKIWSAGRQTYQSSSEQITANTIFDVASLTKTFPTTTLARVLEKEGTWHLSDSLKKWLPEWKGEESLTLEDLVAFRPEFALTLSQEKNQKTDLLLKKILCAPLATPLGTKPPIYSNTTSILLSLALEQATDLSLPELAQQKLFAPLHLKKTSFFAKKDFALKDIAPTEHDPWRDRLIHGEVHDESAYLFQQTDRYFGSAGLFSCAPDILTFLHWHKNTFSGNLGWEQYTPEWMGDIVSPNSYGKTGFTGCCMLIDPETQRGYVFLSNAVHPHRPHKRDTINALRREALSLLTKVFTE